ncbi:MULTISPECIES: biotin--[acetyl-CoA-carboxylase] ligase [Aerococcus]|uniref:biotin--[acetyl-CoA-carboxylase] ligase n=1 Tax=Aerococcus urinae (strain CCUG 59500 / ACS-120-V-Col10a) TaxID=2976812 RepID=UPI000200E59D|nr:biotin--[acetyl-CoA-carboxylase] ligase [Aerococcus sp. Group 1]AEA00801.1 biotin--[acetyl-CoA-carboxylase] ligase [Aerococcus sp. Group 1]MCY3030046.1 biotin--[acetyl-CoA-carboxylase] ligase [Aerococcus sp. Group 1]MCY3054747.1 biotin--[acetyl-CoA-carboxylase] ligase [Aerococcus sp. Group 1]MCY3056477.1 biotin--[acetyl-CoA-carboxylase] ligase [Aerococcus sp. Group 1]MCY3061156.1 biotin--[acetyl-CoA-carboxylase] ligase [Aerococcus sp. Group 1]
MTTSQAVLEQLMVAPLSGQVLADQLNLSRNAVWKAVENLRKEGFVIESGKQGYQIQALPQRLNQSLLTYYLDQGEAKWKLILLDEVGSTNEYIKAYKSQHQDDLVICASQKQTAGKGRLGKSFYSSLEDGLYVSLALKPNCSSPAEVPLYTLLAASAVIDTLGSYLAEPIQVKWVNDLFYQGHKAAGILCEMVSDLEIPSVSYIVIGLGLNLAGDLSKVADIREIAGTFFGKELPKDFNINQFLADLIQCLMTYHHHFAQGEFLDTYKKHLLGLGKEVSYQENQVNKTGKIKGINEQGQLLVEDKAGDIHALISPNIHFGSQQFVSD